MRGLDAGQHHVPDLVIAEVRTAGELDPGVASPIEQHASFNVLAADRLDPLGGSRYTLGLGKREDGLLIIGRDGQVRQFAEASGNALRGQSPGVPCCGIQARRWLPDREELATDGWTTRQGRLSVFVPLALPLCGQGGLRVHHMPSQG